jgi:hypothetical protein
MRVHDAQRNREVLVGFRLDERHLMVVPPDCHWPLYRQIGPRQHRKTLFEAYTPAGAKCVSGQGAEQQYGSEEAFERASEIRRSRQLAPKACQVMRRLARRAGCKDHRRFSRCGIFDRIAAPWHK